MLIDEHTEHSRESQRNVQTGKRETKLKWVIASR